MNCILQTGYMKSTFENQIVNSFERKTYANIISRIRMKRFLLYQMKEQVNKAQIFWLWYQTKVVKQMNYDYKLIHVIKCDFKIDYAKI